MPRLKTAAWRLWSRVNFAGPASLQRDVPGQCWIWTGAKNSWGYGRFIVGGRQVATHRWAYEQAHGPIAADLQADHLCKNRACLRPDHIEPVTAAVNNARSNSVSALNAQKTQCPQGHSLADAYRYSNGTRHCRPCGQKRAREHQRNLRAARRATQQTTTERTAA